MAPGVSAEWPVHGHADPPITRGALQRRLHRAFVSSIGRDPDIQSRALLLSLWTRLLDAAAAVGK
jgi:hypothetical protein